MQTAALVPHSTYVRDLRPVLPEAAFQPATSRLVLVPAHLAVIAVAIVTAALGWLPLWLAPLVSIAIGISFASLTFVAHEAMHGGIVRNRLARRIVGWIGFLPFTL